MQVTRAEQAAMPEIIPSPLYNDALGGKNGLRGRLYPNGEVILWQQQSHPMEPLEKPPEPEDVAMRMGLLHLLCVDRTLGEAMASILGLSNVTIFDKNSKPSDIKGSLGVPPRARKGLRGLSAHGGRMVRNAVYVLERRYGPSRLGFSTVTLPSLPRKQVQVVQENWDKVTEIFRLGVRRRLQKQGLSGEIVTVSEVQMKRYQKSSLPYLHLHSVFLAVDRQGRYAISIEEHDRLWWAALRSVTPIKLDDVASACNLQRVRKSAAAYLGKYLSKSVKVIEQIVEAGFASWLPYHWYNCSRSLAAEVRNQTRRIDGMADWLDEVARAKNLDVWRWHRLVSLEVRDGVGFNVARIGCLTEEFSVRLHKALTVP